MIVRKIIFLAVITAMLSLPVFAQVTGEFQAPPASEEEAMLKGHPYYLGMTKEALYKIYPPASQQAYFTKGNEEWIVFDDILTTGDLKDIISFYLRDGKVVGWDKKGLPKTPAERLQAIEARHRHSIGATSLDDGNTFRQRRIEDKEETRRRNIEERRSTWVVTR